jgi:hypothetical protein
MEIDFIDKRQFKSLAWDTLKVFTPGMPKQA